MHFKYAEIDPVLLSHEDFIQTINELKELHFLDLNQDSSPDFCPLKLHIASENGFLSIRDNYSGPEGPVAQRQKLSPGCIETETSHNLGIFTVFLNEKRGHIITVGADQTLRIYSSFDHKNKNCRLQRNAGPFAFLICWDETLVVFEDRDSNELIIFDYIAEKALPYTFKGHKNQVRKILRSRLNPKVIFSCSLDCSIKAWDFSTRTCIFNFQSGLNGFYSIVFAKDEDFFFFGCGNGEIIIYSIDSKEVHFQLKNGHSEAVSCLLLSKDEKSLFSGGFDGQIVAWNLEQKIAQSCLSINSPNKRIYSMVFSQTEEQIFSCGIDGNIRIWDLGLKDCVQVLSGHKYDVLSIAVSKSERLIYSAGMDSTLRVWSLSRYIYSEKPKEVQFSKNGAEVLNFRFGEKVKVEEIVFHDDLANESDAEDDDEYVLTIEEDGIPVLTVDFKVEVSKNVAQSEFEIEQQIIDSQVNNKSTEIFKSDIKMTQISIQKAIEDVGFFTKLVELAVQKNLKICFASFKESGQLQNVLYLENLDNDDGFSKDIIYEYISKLMIEFDENKIKEE